MPAAATQPRAVVAAAATGSADVGDDPTGLGWLRISEPDRRGIVPRNPAAHSDDLWTSNQIKLLYLISRYSRPAQSKHEPEQWVRPLRFTRRAATRVL